MRPHHVALCGLAVPLFTAFAVWAAVNWMIAFRTDPQAYVEADEYEYFQQMQTLFSEPPR